MRFHIIFLTIIASISLGPALLRAEFKPFEGPKPIAVFIQTDPWAMVIGADTPRVAVYEDGEVVFVKKVKERRVYHHVTLDKAGLAKLREHFKPVLAVKDLKTSYNMHPNVTDLPESRFYFRDGDREIATNVYGLMAPETKLPGYTEFPSKTKPTSPPKELLALHKWLCGLDYPDSKQWTPKYIEVMLWDYGYAPDPSIQWPAAWPSLTSDRAMKRGDSYSIFLDGSLLPKLRKFLSTKKPKGAVEIGGKKMAVSYRFTFPGEPVWRKAFEQTAHRDTK